MFLRGPKVSILVGLWVAFLVAGCTRDPGSQNSVRVDSSYTRTESPQTSAKPFDSDALQLPSVPDIGTKEDSTVQATSLLPESDSMDVRAKITLKSVASAETVVRGVQLFVLGVDRMDSLTILHLMMQNLWGSGTKVHPEPIPVKLGADQLGKAKLLDDQTGKTFPSDPNLAAGKVPITNAIDWKLKPGEMKPLTLAFGPLSRASRTATLIIPGFATVTRIALNP